MLYAQTTEAEKYLDIVAGIAPTRLLSDVQNYKIDRALVLGLQITRQNQQGQAVPVSTSSLKLADRLTALGTGFGPMIEANSRKKAYLENEINIAVEALGGFSAILPTSQWAFVLNDVTRDINGNITGYALPSLPFLVSVPSTTPNVPAAVYSVNITLNSDGSGTASFAAVNSTTPSNGDPL